MFPGVRCSIAPLDFCSPGALFPWSPNALWSLGAPLLNWSLAPLEYCSPESPRVKMLTGVSLPNSFYSTGVLVLPGVLCSLEPWYPTTQLLSCSPGLLCSVKSRCCTAPLESCSPGVLLSLESLCSLESYAP